jgi:LmbE family N-acetylglucosaminyl deacetylase
MHQASNNTHNIHRVQYCNYQHCLLSVDTSKCTDHPWPFVVQEVTLGGELAAPRRGEKGDSACRLATHKLLVLRQRAAAAGGAAGAEAQVQMLTATLEQLLPRERPRVNFAPLPTDGQDEPQ